MDLRYTSWAFRRTLNWTLLLLAGVMAEAVFHKGINLTGLFGVSLLGWAALFSVYMSDERTKKLYRQMTAPAGSKSDNGAAL